MTEFLVAYGFIFLSELGDKTQLMAISLQMKYKNRWAVLLGISCGLAMVMIVGVIIGLILKQSLEQKLVNIIAGIIFLGAALYQLKEILEHDEDTTSEEDSTLEKGDDRVPASSSPAKMHFHEILGTTAVMMFLAELGDKTQIVFISLVASQSDFIFITIGALLALITVNALGILFADVLTRYLNVKVLNWIVLVLFLVFGVLLLIEGLNLAPSNSF